MTEPVSLAEAKAHLRVSETSEDGLIGNLIVAARSWVEGYTGLVLTSRAVVETVAGFGARIGIAAWPVQSITSVAYLDAAGVAQTLGPGAFLPFVARRPASILPLIGGAWPTTAALPGAVTVTLQAGFPTPADVPTDLKQAMLLLIGQWFAVREGVVAGVSVAEVPMAVIALCQSHRPCIV